MISHRRYRSSWSLTLSVALPLLFAVGFPPLQAMAQKRAVLSDAGRVVTVAKVPNALKMADFSNHLGLVRPGTRVEVLQRKRDPVIPATWVQVRLLEGAYKGKVGWALAPTVMMKQDRGAAKQGNALRQGDRLARRRGDNRPPRPDVLKPKGATHQVTAGTAAFGTPSIFSPTDQQVEEGVWVKVVGSQQDSLTSFLWKRIEFVSGKAKGQTVWVPSHVLKGNSPKVALILDPTDKATMRLLKPVAEHPDVDVFSTVALETAVDEQVDLSQYQEIGIVNHRCPLPGMLTSGDNARTLAAKLRKGRVNKSANIELFVCNAGRRNAGERQTTASQLSRFMKRPIHAYSHYVRVTVARKLGFPRPRIRIKISGYTVKTDVFTGAQTVQMLKAPDRRIFRPGDATDAGTPVGGLPLLVKTVNGG